MTTLDAASTLAAAIADARRQALAAELRPWIAEARALVAVASGVRALARKALAPPTPPVEIPAPAADRGPRIGRNTARVRGPIVGQVIVTSPHDPFLSLMAASDYTGLSVKTLRRAVNDAPERALPHYRVGAVILVRRSEADAWLSQRRGVGRPSLVAALRDLGLVESK